MTHLSTVFKTSLPCQCDVQGGEEDVEMADAPDEYLDPITYTVMQDPVKLPSGTVMDRPNVMRMLLSDPRDPTTRSVPCAILASGFFCNKIALERQDSPRTYLAHHTLESVIIIFFCVSQTK